MNIPFTSLRSDLLDAAVRSYIPILSRMLEHPVKTPYGFLILSVSVVLSAGILHAALQPATDRSIYFKKSLLCMAVVIGLSPVFLMMVEFYARDMQPGMNEAFKRFLGLLIPGVLLGSIPITHQTRSSFYAAVISMVLAICVWMMFIFSVAFAESFINKNLKNTEPIRQRTSEMDRFLNP